MPPQTTNYKGTNRRRTDHHGFEHQTAWLDSMGAVVAVVVMAVYAFTVVAPYFLIPATGHAVLEIIKSNKSTVDLITTAVVMFYFGASVGRRKDQETVGALAQTSARQASALAPSTATTETETKTTVTETMGDKL